MPGFFLGDNNFTKQKYRQEEYYRCKENWHYEPKNISFNDAVEEFTHIFETLILNNIKNKKIILPLSGGLDSRTIASALRNTEILLLIHMNFWVVSKKQNMQKELVKKWIGHFIII